MFKCTGICSKCGRCKSLAKLGEIDDNKMKMLEYPPGFAADKGGTGFGVAFDIGTTTVVGMLWDLEAGEQIAVASRKNPQAEYGADVITRITYCGRNGEHLNDLRRLITDCLREITGELCDKAECAGLDITKVTVGGNTTMSHLFAGYPVMSLALAPFSPAYTGSLCMSADEAHLALTADEKRGADPDAEVTVLPNIAGHVGGDITAGIVASGILDINGRASDPDQLTLFIDIGTNGEIVLISEDLKFACSTAAGPAFETCETMRGSELIDAVARMLESGIIDETGKLIGNKEEAASIGITQGIIREVQLAKGAIAAGIQLMLKHAGKSEEDIGQIIVAGAFGNYINKESAVRIGLLPDIPLERIKSVGNAAGAGVSMTLVSRAEMELAKKIPSLIKHIELAEDLDFQDVYLKALGF